MGIANWLQPLVVVSFYCFNVILQKHASLDEFFNILWYIGFIADLITVKGAAYVEDYGIRLCGGMCSKVWQGKPRLMVASDQSKLSVSAILNA